MGGVLNEDETAFVKANSTPAINLVEVGATESLNKWVYDLAKEDVDIGVMYSGMMYVRIVPESERQNDS